MSHRQRSYLDKGWTFTRITEGQETKGNTETVNDSKGPIWGLQNGERNERAEKRKGGKRVTKEQNES